MFDPTPLHIFLALIIGDLAFFGLGLYIGERGMAGVKIDLDNVKLELAHLKGYVSGNGTTVVQTTPAA